MKLVIYRDKETQKITSYHEVTAKCTDEALQRYNSDEKQKTTAEIVALDEIAEYFYTLKTASIENEAETLRDLMSDLRAISDRIDERLYEFDNWFENEREGSNE